MTCVEHTQKGTGLGYGSTTVKDKGKRRRVAMHRAVYCKAHGIEVHCIDGMVVRHTCDNARCINPEHLEIGTAQDNVDDRTARQRGYRKMTPEQVAFARKHYKPHCREFGSAALARRFGVDASCVNRAVNNHGWEDVCPA